MRCSLVVFILSISSTKSFLFLVIIMGQIIKKAFLITLTHPPQQFLITVTLVCSLCFYLAM